MPLPAGVSARTVRLTVPLDALGNAPKVYTGTVKPDRALVWTATGDRLWPTGAQLPAPVDGVVEFDVPRVDQNGWVDRDGTPVENWAYRLVVRAFWETSKRSEARTFQVFIDDPEPVEIELLPSGATEPVVLGDPYVSSFLGRSGAITESVATNLMNGVFAEKSAQDVIEFGRLEDSVLAQRFGIRTIYIPANQMVIALGTPVNTVISGLNPCWRLDAATDEGVSFGVEIPQEWATFDVHVRGVNIGAGAGAVRLVVQHNNAAGEGDDVTVGTSSGAGVIFTAAAQNIRTTAVARTDLTNDYTKAHIFRVFRDADHAGDTLANDWAVTGVELVATSFVTFTPETPEEPEDLTGQAFTEADNANLAGLRVFQQNTPPVDNTDNEDFKFFPGTDYAAATNVTTTWTGGNVWRFLWANRYNYADGTAGTPHNSRPNPLPHPTVFIGTRQCRSAFTTAVLADAATRAQVRHVLGMDAADVEAVWTAAGGVVGDLIDEADFRASPATYCDTEFSHAGSVFMVMVDKVVLPTNTLLDGPNPSLNAGIALDYEVQDGRIAAQTTALLDAIATDVHAESKELFLYTNPLSGSSAPYNGLDDTNLPDILADVDYMGVLLWSGADEGNIPDSWDAQIDLLGGTLTTAEWAKIVPIFELGVSPGTTIEDAEWLRAKLTEVGDDHPSAVWFWRNGAQYGGGIDRLTNQKIETICFGA
jgi:hypothetical protein